MRYGPRVDRQRGDELIESMYIYDDKSTGSQERPNQSPVLRPSRVYRYADLQSRDNQTPGFVSFLGDFAGPLPDDIRDTWKARGDKQEIFKILREQKSFPLDAAVTTELRKIFATGSSERWLAEKLAQQGPEALWPFNDLKDRVTHAKKIGAEPGNYKATLPDPNPGSTLTGALSGCVDNLKPTQLPEAFFFPGTSDRRALVIAGIHGDEKRGVDVVKGLQTVLAKDMASGTKPFFTTILVPIVIPRTQAGSGSRLVPGGLGLSTTGALKCRNIEPNRNYPLPGEDLAAARARGISGVSAVELVIKTAAGVRAPKDSGTASAFWTTSIRMLPETRILLSLIERFQPERLASVHDHSLIQACHPCAIGVASKCGVEGPGIFVDPRGIDPVTNKVTDLTKVQEDDAIGKKMAQAALSRLPCDLLVLKPKAFPPFAGNQVLFPPGVRYFSPARVEGNSLGDWGPVPTTSRPGIATLTIEVPKYNAADAAVEKFVKELHRDVLQQVFLQKP